MKMRSAIIIVLAVTLWGCGSSLPDSIPQDTAPAPIPTESVSPPLGEEGIVRAPDTAPIISPAPEPQHEIPLTKELQEIYEENSGKVGRKVLEEFSELERKEETPEKPTPVETPAPVEPAVPTTPAQETEKEADVEIPGKDTVAVLISLRAPVATEPNQEGENPSGEIARVQEEVLQELGSEEFALKYQYDIFPVLAGKVTREGLETLLANDLVTHIDSDMKLELHLAQSVPLIGANTAQSLGASGQGITIAIIDTGIDYNHPDLGGCLGPTCKVRGGWDFFSNDSDPIDGQMHGTHVAGIVASSKRGVAPQANLVALKVFGGGGTLASNANIIAAIQWAITNQAAHNIRAINMSLGAGGYTATCDWASTQMTQAIQTARNRGIITFVSSGNDGFANRISFPACISSAVSVGSVYDANIGSISWPNLCADPTTSADQVTCYSNSAPILNLLAPGSAISSTVPGGIYAIMHGTSMASPHAAGVAALMMSVDGGLTPDRIRDTLINTGTRLTDAKSNVATPRINARAAVEAVMTDTDRDGVLDVYDNCREIPNADQADADGDGKGDLCDNIDNRQVVLMIVNSLLLDDGEVEAPPNPEDIDSDGVTNATDNCPSSSNADQADGDLDDTGDACDGSTLVILAPQALSFQTSSSTSQYLYVLFRNVSRQSVRIYSLTSSDGHFRTYFAGTRTVQPGGLSYLWVSFSSASPGNFSGQLTIRTDVPGRESIVVPMTGGRS